MVGCFIDLDDKSIAVVALVVTDGQDQAHCRGDTYGWRAANSQPSDRLPQGVHVVAVERFESPGQQRLVDETNAAIQIADPLDGLGLVGNRSHQRPKKVRQVQ